MDEKLPAPPWDWDARGIVKYLGSVGDACEGCPRRYCGMLTAYGAGRMFCSDCELIGWREASGEG